MRLIEIKNEPPRTAMLMATAAKVGEVTFNYNYVTARWVSDICDQHWVDGDTLILMGARFYRPMLRERAVLNGPQDADAVGAWNPMIEVDDIRFKEYAGFSLDDSRHRIFVFSKDDEEAVAAIGKLMEEPCR